MEPNIQNHSSYTNTTISQVIKYIKFTYSTVSKFNIG